MTLKLISLHFNSKSCLGSNDATKSQLKNFLEKLNPVEYKVMNNPIKISVIVPVYNTKDYLRECFDSVLNQSLSDIELLIVDDGSDDGGWDIIEEYAAKFSNVYSFKQNRKRQGAARNLALQYAKGEFVAFLDSDDTIPHQAYEHMYHLAEQNSTDMTVGIQQSFSEKRKWIGVPVHKNKFTEIKELTNVFELPELLTDISACNRIIRRSSIDKYQITFSEKVSGEDLDFMARLYLRTKRISILPEPVYNYRSRPGASTARISYDFFRDRVWVTQELKRYYMEYGGEAIFPYLLRSEIRKLVGNRFSRVINSLQNDEQTEIFDSVHLLAKQLTADDILDSNDFPYIGQIRIIFLKHQQFDALVAYEKQPNRARFQSLITDDSCKQFLFDPMMGLSRSRIQQLNRNSISGSNLKKLLIYTARRIKNRVQLINKANISKAFALVKYFALYPVSFFQKDTSSQGIWLIDERESQSAEDNSYYLFSYIRKQYPELRIYYVINEFSNQKEKVKPLGNVVDLFSWKHFMLLHRARVLLSTDSFKNLAFPFHIFPGLRQNTHNVFLQHGVSGNKTTTYFKKNHPSFSNIIVTSENEKKMFTKTYGFHNHEVNVTGFSRFDQLLLKRAVPPQNKILIASTWRKWLKGQSNLYSSKYFFVWAQLIKNVKFSELLEEYNVDVYFQPHFNMMKFINEFEGVSERIHIQDKEYPLQEHIKNCDLLITDYSSVMYDFFYQEKPVICYMFDREEWEKQLDGPPLINFDNDLPSDLVYSVNEVINSLEEYFKNQFMMKAQHLPKIDNFFKYRDHNNCERIYQSIVQAIS